MRRRLTRKKSIIGPVALCILASCISGGCGARFKAARPSIEFTRIPPADATRTDKLDIIQGRVNGARPGQQIVLYTKTQAWWIQPLFNNPFTGIQPDSTWVNSTHVGSEYAALLVEPDYKPMPMVNTLPVVGGD